MSEFGQIVWWKLQKPDDELISKIGVEKRGFKVCLHNNQDSTIDILPEYLIHKILSFLSFEEATRMSILSKIWLRAWFNYPNLKFTLKNDMKTVDTIMERYRDAKIPIEKFELSEDYDGSSSEDLAFPLIEKWLDIALTNGVKDLGLYFGLYLTSYPLPIFTILAAKSVRELAVQECILLPFSLSNGVVNCSSLRKLSLSDVKLDENMIHTLLYSCPLIVSCIFEYCSGYKTIGLRNLQKIKSVSLKLLKIKYCGGIWEIDAPNLESLEYTSYEIPQLKISSELTQLKHSEISLQCLKKDLNAAWFLKLRKSLSNSISWSQVCIEFYKWNKIDIKTLQLDQRGSNPLLDVLKVTLARNNEESQSFVDALIWSCQPRRLELQSTRRKTTIFIDHLMNMKNSSHSTSQGINLWYSRLKEVKVYRFDRKKESWHPVEHKSEELATRNFQEWDTCYIVFY